jgi:hypothetical protein
VRLDSRREVPLETLQAFRGEDGGQFELARASRERLWAWVMQAERGWVTEEEWEYQEVMRRVEGAVSEYVDRVVFVEQERRMREVLRRLRERDGVLADEVEKCLGREWLEQQQQLFRTLRAQQSMLQDAAYGRLNTKRTLVPVRKIECGEEDVEELLEDSEHQREWIGPLRSVRRASLAGESGTLGEKMKGVRRASLAGVDNPRGDKVKGVRRASLAGVDHPRGGKMKGLRRASLAGVDHPRGDKVKGKDKEVTRETAKIQKLQIKMERDGVGDDGTEEPGDTHGITIRAEVKRGKKKKNNGRGKNKGKTNKTQTNTQRPALRRSVASEKQWMPIDAANPPRATGYLSWISHFWKVD